MENMFYDREIIDRYLSVLNKFSNSMYFFPLKFVPCLMSEFKEEPTTTPNSIDEIIQSMQQAMKYRHQFVAVFSTEAELVGGVAVIDLNLNSIVIYHFTNWKDADKRQTFVMDLYNSLLFLLIAKFDGLSFSGIQLMLVEKIIIDQYLNKKTNLYYFCLMMYFNLPPLIVRGFGDLNMRYGEELFLNFAFLLIYIFVQLDESSMNTLKDHLDSIGDLK
jgi:hypothetical protein